MMSTIVSMLGGCTDIYFQRDRDILQNRMWNFGRKFIESDIQNRHFRWATENWNGITWPNMTLLARNIGIRNLGNSIITSRHINLRNSDLKARRNVMDTVELKKCFRPFQILRINLFL